MQLVTCFKIKYHLKAHLECQDSNCKNGIYSDGVRNNPHNCDRI